MRRNPFFARPQEFHGAATRGVATHPGFHTADQVETTYAYAQMKAVPEHVSEEVPAEVVLIDYPVVVALNMKGLDALTDYDAIETVKPILVEVAKEVVSQPGEDPIDALQDYVEYGERQHEMLTRAYQWLFEMGAPAVMEPAPSLLSYAEAQDDPNELICALADGTLPNEALAEITGQHRYLEDVSTERIVSVIYLRPWWPEILELWPYGSDDTNPMIEELDELGWSVITDDDVGSFSLPEISEMVFERSAGPSPRIEYHGTSYLNLLKAAPWLRRHLPEPPQPYSAEAAY